MPVTTRPRLEDDVATILQSLDIPPTSQATPTLVVCAGLPGTGKSTFSRRIATETGAVVLESVPAYHVAAGVPAKTIRDRRKKD